MVGGETAVPVSDIGRRLPARSPTRQYPLRPRLAASVSRSTALQNECYRRVGWPPTGRFRRSARPIAIRTPGRRCRRGHVNSVTWPLLISSRATISPINWSKLHWVTRMSISRCSGWPFGLDWGSQDCDPVGVTTCYRSAGRHPSSLPRLPLAVPPASPARGSGRHHGGYAVQHLGEGRFFAVGAQAGGGVGDHLEQAHAHLAGEQ